MSQGNGPLLSIVRLLAKRATIMLGKVVTKNNNVYNSFTSSSIHAIHFHAIHGQCPSTCPRFQYEQINQTLAKHDVDKRLSSTRSFTFYQVSLLHASCVRNFVSSSHHSKKTATCLYEQNYVLLVFWGEVVSNCPTKPTNLPNNPTVVWFSAHLWVPLVDWQLSPNTS